MTLLILSPHRDDAAFSLGLAIEDWLRAGHKITVLNCFTQSSYAPYSDADLVHQNDKTSFVSAVRRKEDVAWNKLLQNKLTFRDLDMLDAPLRLACEVEEVLSVAIRPGDRAVARIAGAVRKLASAAKNGDLALAAPLSVGGHIDHRVVRQAALEAVQDEAFPLAFYEDLPYAATGAKPSIEEVLEEQSGLNLQPCFALPPAADTQAAIKQKRRMAECYDSQIDSEVAQQLATFAERYAGRERLWANTAWRTTTPASAV